MKINVLRKLILCALSAWLGMVIFTDFIVVPAVFTTISKRLEAGELGMSVFAALGSFEVVVGLFIFLAAGIVLKKFKTRRALILFFLASTLYGLTLMGRFYLTPELTVINRAKYTLEESSSEYQQLNQRHQFLHGLYVKLDSIKMLLLISGLLMSFRQSRFDHEKILNIPFRREK